MNDTEIGKAWSTLEPDGRCGARIETRVFEWLETAETSLLAEWLSVLKLEPLTSLAFVSVGAASLVLLTPLGWMTACLFQ